MLQEAKDLNLETYSLAFQCEMHAKLGHFNKNIFSFNHGYNPPVRKKNENPNIPVLKMKAVFKQKGITVGEDVCLNAEDQIL